jgi:ABC-type multidrug transport system permease subunit
VPRRFGGAQYETTSRVFWFVAAALLFAIVMYGMAEILAARVPSTEEYVGILPAIAIVPFFFAGSLFPITALPPWLADVARVLPLTHSLALFRYGLTSTSGSQALQNIWGMHSAATMAVLSLGVVALYAMVILGLAIRLFTRSGKS